MEKIQSAAIRYEGKVYTGPSHANIHFSDRIPWKIGEEGFVTTDGRFVDRAEAMKLAKEAKQIKEHGSVNPIFLHSCDLI